MQEPYDKINSLSGELENKNKEIEELKRQIKEQDNQEIIEKDEQIKALVMRLEQENIKN